MRLLLSKSLALLCCSMVSIWCRHRFILFPVYLKECWVNPASCMISLTCLINSLLSLFGIMMGGGNVAFLFLALTCASSCCSSKSIVISASDSVSVRVSNLFWVGIDA